MAKPLANLKTFISQLDIPPAEHDALAVCLGWAVDAAQGQGLGSESASLTPRDVLRVPRLLGGLAVAVVRHPALSPETKLKVVRYTVGHARHLEDNGTPHGLTVLLSFLAGAGELDVATFTAALKMAEIERALFEEVTLADLQMLTDWLLGQPELDERQRLWWLWYLVGNCGKYQLGQPWMDALLTHPALSTAFKHRLCEAWLSARPPAPAPQRWRALDQALAAELRLDDPPETGAPADLDGSLLSLLDSAPGGADDDGDDYMAALGVASHLMRSALGGYVLIPAYVRRRAVLGLAQTGDDPLAVCQRYLESDPRDDLGTLNQGVADVLREFHGQVPPDVVSALIERGLKLPQTKTRQAFYTVAANLYGPHMWQRAQQDNAASVRQWAAKKATTDDGRPPLGKRRGRRTTDR